jgi:hypothetical protein
MIMAMVFQATQSENADVRTAAYNCLVEIAATYYDLMPAYIKDIFNVRDARMPACCPPHAD